MIMNNLQKVVVLGGMMLMNANAMTDVLEPTVYEHIKQGLEQTEEGSPGKDVVTWDEVRSFRVEAGKHLGEMLLDERSAIPDVARGSILLQLSTIMYELNEEQLEKKYREGAFLFFRKTYSDERDLILFLYNTYNNAVSLSSKAWYALLTDKKCILHELNDLVIKSKQPVAKEVLELLTRRGV